MQFFLAEFAFRPARHASDGVLLRAVSFSCTRSVLRFGEIVDLTEVATYPDQENPLPALRDAVLLRVQYFPDDTVSGKTVPVELVRKKNLVFPVGHSIHVLDDERSRADYPKNAIKFLIEKIDRFEWVSASALTVSLAGITTDQKLGLREFVEPPDVALNHIGILLIDSVCFAGDIPDVVRPNNLEPCPHEGQIAPAATAEE